MVNFVKIKMDFAIKLIPSGSEFIENTWGGFYSGGNYLLYGERKTGKTLFALNFIKSSLKERKKCIYFTNSNPKKIIIQAASIGFDAEKYLNDESLIIFKTPEPENGGKYFIEYYKNISYLVKKFNSCRIVVDELTPYLNFINLRQMNSSLDELIEELSVFNVTSLFLLKEPSGEDAELALDLVKDKLTGSIHLKKDKTEDYSGKIFISPNYGHTEGEFSGEYKIVPGKGFANISDNVIMESGKFYKSVSSLQEYFEYSNLYSYDDFLLILNNQISFCKVTRQECALVSVKVEGDKAFKELRDIIWRISEKKNKISSRGNNILIFIKENKETFLEDLENAISEKNEVITPEAVLISEADIDKNISGAEELIEKVLREENSRNLKILEEEIEEKEIPFTRYSTTPGFSTSRNKIQWR